MAVIGDLIADEYIVGDTDRVSREAPVLILKYQSSAVRPGGAGNALANLRTLGARAVAFGVVGDDEAGRCLLDELTSREVDTADVLVSPEFPTVRKTRVMAGGFHTVRQQIVRIDREAPGAVPASREADVWERFLGREDQLEAVLFSDYGQGTLTPSLAERVIALGQRHGWRLTADSRHRLGVFRGVTVACPNESEAGPAAGIDIVDEESLHRAGSALVRSLDLAGLVITRGRLGMTVFEPGSRITDLPIYLDCDAADVTGAGDTVAAVLTLALAVGASLGEAAALANCAGSLVVMKRGTATVSADEIDSALG